MYVCICKSVSHYEIEKAVKRGDVRSVSCLRKSLGVGTQCGTCLNFAKECLSETLTRHLMKNAQESYEIRPQGRRAEVLT